MLPVGQVSPGLPVFVKPQVALFFIQLLSFRKMKLQDRQNGPRAYKQKLAGLRP